MIDFYQNYSLKGAHTFSTEASARFFLEFSEPAELQLFLSKHPDLFERVLILGGGSNLLFRDDFPGLVIHPAIPGISLADEDDRQVRIRAGAGVWWDDFVRFAVDRGWGGVENLSLIPGKVGAVPVQNIGAYGQEAAAVIDSVTGISLVSGELMDIPAADCQFGYRESVFKKELNGRFVVTSVVFRLEKKPELKISYRDVAEKLMTRDNITVSTVRDTIVEIRRTKLPDPAWLGNAGSFFKNPVVKNEKVKELQRLSPAIPVYRENEGYSKLSSGWLIDQCGWKGFRRGDAGVHERHALVLVNYGKATGKEIFELSEEIRQSVFRRFGVDLEREVMVIP